MHWLQRASRSEEAVGVSCVGFNTMSFLGVLRRSTTLTLDPSSSHALVHIQQQICNNTEETGLDLYQATVHPALATFSSNTNSQKTILQMIRATLIDNTFPTWNPITTPSSNMKTDPRLALNNNTKS
jgi:hypothetical protein